MLGKKKNNLAKILTLIAIFLILVYGLDAALDRSDTGFLPFDSKTRGLVLGLPSVILPLIAFGITYRSPSTSLGGLLIIDGIIILIGSILSVSLQETTPRIEQSVIIENFVSFAPIIALGLVIIFLGIWKSAR
ncbi:hypothetical protein HX860_02100 [Marine Group I thaumarchaeote]|uniref:Uncharacterized protein n=1 Tax=Marine Group I thaumarchaeote TaxID=2511932 RepID=A0A7K4P4A1_9ARCH|nr:hypothetical protein [Marine Group I thaumarchaeote]NWK09508.1 hypothetical protein [Marine Group I thaumarchaeote]